VINIKINGIEINSITEMDNDRTENQHKRRQRQKTV